MAIEQKIDDSKYSSKEYWPKISIITPSFNQGLFIEETILSVINQNYPNLEFIIIDGASSDNSVEIIKKYEEKITFWVSEKDSGQSNAINKGIEKATGEIFNWLNSDDTLTPNSLFNVATLYNKFRYDVLCGKSRHFDNESNMELNIGYTYFHKTIEKTIAHYSMSQPSTFYRLDLIKKLGGINEDLHYAMDAELWFKYLLFAGNTKKVIKTDIILANFRIHNDSKTNSQKSLFINDTNALYHGLLNSVNAPVFALEPYENPINNRYQKKWEPFVLNNKHFLGYFAQKNTTYFYTQFNYKKAKLNNRLAIKYMRINIRTIIYFIKLHLFPTSILNFVRNKKR